MERTVHDPAGPERYGLGLLAFDLSCGSFWGKTSAFMTGGGSPEITVTVSRDGSPIAVVLTRGQSQANPDVAALLCRKVRFGHLSRARASSGGA